MHGQKRDAHPHTGKQIQQQTGIIRHPQQCNRGAIHPHPRLRCLSFCRLLIWVGSSSIWLLNMLSTSRFFRSEMLAGTAGSDGKGEMGKKRLEHDLTYVFRCTCILRQALPHHGPLRSLHTHTHTKCHPPSY